MRVYEITLSREAQTLSMSEPRGGPEFKSVHSVWTDWQMPLPWTAGLLGLKKQNFGCGKQDAVDQLRYPTARQFGAVRSGRIP
jgi:hypothetical protein